MEDEEIFLNYVEVRACYQAGLNYCLYNNGFPEYKNSDFNILENMKHFLEDCNNGNMQDKMKIIPKELQQILQWFGWIDKTWKYNHKVQKLNNIQICVYETLKFINLMHYQSF
jgi:hypothetical protein